MQENAELSQQIIINRFAFLLLKHFDNTKIKVQDTMVKVNVNQLCRQDLEFLVTLNKESGDVLGFNISKSGKGVVVLIGVAQLKSEIIWLNKYKRS